MRRPPVLFVHGAFCGGWCLEGWVGKFRDAGFTVLAPDLPEHGEGIAASGPGLCGLGLGDYLSALQSHIDAMEEKPVIVGHSMGGLLAQLLAARAQARAIVLLASAPPAGIAPQTAGEREAAQGLMAAGPFWDMVLTADFDMAVANSLTHMPEEARRPLFERFCRESGQALFETMFWMFDAKASAHIAPGAVSCPVRVINGDGDVLTSMATARRIAARYHVEAEEARGFGHFLIAEPGWQRLADDVIGWIETLS